MKFDWTVNVVTSTVNLTLIILRGFGIGIVAFTTT